MVNLVKGRKRQQVDTNPLQAANAKTDDDFLRDYIQHSTHSTCWFPQWNHPRTAAVYRLSLRSPAALSVVDLQACFALVEETSRPDYEASAGKWRPRAKLQEMRSPELRYVLVRDAAGAIRGFTSLMPTFEQGQPVVYCYEIHLKPELQGTGLAAKLMDLLVAVAENLPPIEKVMLTCFLSNQRALGFYERLGFVRDDISPEPKVLRSGETHVPDYVIMSRTVARKGANPDLPTSKRRVHAVG